MELLLVQLLVLCATGALFWIARRDLRSRVPTVSLAPPETQELEQLCVTLEALVSDLSRRLDRLERHVARPSPRAASDPQPPLSDRGNLLTAPALSKGEGKPNADAALDARYAPIYDLLDAGVSDPQEITRRVGMSRGEVDLILSLRGRRAL